jgi:membrane-associated phospholipid phosphatase
MTTRGFAALGREWPLKLAVAGVLALGYCTGYLWIERHPWREPIVFALTAVDRWTGFDPNWIWVYQSVYALLPFGLLAVNCDEIRRYAVGFTLLTAASFACFCCCPVLGPRPAGTPISGMYGALVHLDLPLNSFPSLHMAVATYAACVARRFFPSLAIALTLWVLLIGYSTLALKQHYLVDLPPGIVLGWLAYRFAWR